MATLLERVAKAVKRRADAELELRAALVAAKPTHSWRELAKVTGLTRSGVVYLVEQGMKGENSGGSGGPSGKSDARGNAGNRVRRGRDARRSEGEA